MLLLVNNIIVLYRCVWFDNITLNVNSGYLTHVLVVTIIFFFFFLPEAAAGAVSAKMICYIDACIIDIVL